MNSQLAIGSRSVALEFSRNKPSVTGPARTWREEDGIIHFSIVFDGTSGPEWIDRLEGNGCRVEKEARKMLLSPDFKPTSPRISEIAVLKGSIFKDDHRVTKEVIVEAGRRKLTKLNNDAACFIRETFTNAEIEAMGLRRIVTLGDESPIVLGAQCLDDGQWLNVSMAERDTCWFRNVGFAFEVTSHIL